MNKIKCSLPFIILIFYVFNSSIYSQSLQLPETHFSFTVNGGASMQLAGNTDGLFSYIEYNVSLQRIELKFSYNFDRSILSLFLGQDEYLLKKTWNIEPQDARYYYENNRWLGLSYLYKIIKNKNIELYGGYELAGNADTQFMNFKAGIIKPINQVLTMNFALRFTSVFKESFETNVGNQLGIDYGIAYNF